MLWLRGPRLDNRPCPSLHRATPWMHAAGCRHTESAHPATGLTVARKPRAVQVPAQLPTKVRIKVKGQSG